jgi:glycerol-3-phosphate acyltransferase PlsX
VANGVTIALDAMGGDHGVRAAIGGAARLSLEDSGIRVLAVGDISQMDAALSAVPHDPRRIQLVAARGVVPMDAHPREALTELPDCSILTAARLVAEGEADAVVSAGNTGATVLACATRFKLIPGISRAALASVYPTERRHGPRRDPFALMLDVGATVTADADALVGFALMGAAYSSIISEIPSPKVALLSNGAEATKGTPAIVEAHQRLRSASVDFRGNIEGLDIPRGSVDVVVCDGFLGNVVLKMLEGIGDVLQNLTHEAGARSLQWKIGLQMLEGGLAELKRLTDWKGYGGAPLLGFDHVAIKAHGRSEAGAIRNAIKVAGKAVRGDLQGRIRAAIDAAPRSDR